MNTNVIEPILTIVVCGFMGGLTNCILFNTLELPYRETSVNGRSVLRFGSLGPLLLGVAASFLTWGFGVESMSNASNKWALLFLSGIGGASVIINYMQKNKIEIEKQTNETSNAKLEGIAENLRTTLMQLNDAKNAALGKNKEITHE
ncbi:MAG: hypothetical protein PHO08_19480 [Methylococcales bacterium]|nr:hypothetical protein [Methylococcales bacterium]MDD5630988.1 hypothetical protein [Methylococcales bacterium]